jgi:hypothetical protein
MIANRFLEPPPQHALQSISASYSALKKMKIPDARLLEQEDFVDNAQGLCQSTNQSNLQQALT